MRPDSSILGETEGFKSLAIVGCPACANYCLAYEKDEPVQKLVTDEKTGSSSRLPVALMKEINRVKGLLEDRGASVVVEVWPAVCITTVDPELQWGGPQYTDPELVNRCSEVEAVVALCCALGVLGLKHRFGKDVKVVSGMRTEGLFRIHFTLDRDAGLVYIDKEKSRIIRNL